MINMKTKLLIILSLLIFTLGYKDTIEAQIHEAQNEEKEQLSKRYVCPMHPEVVRDNPGKCPICGMKLQEEKQDEYYCPMHPDYVSKNPGKCPKCGMRLKKDGKNRSENFKNTNKL